MRVYYELQVWEEVDEYDIEVLKNRSLEFGKRLNGFGILSFQIKAQPPQQAQQQQQQQEQEQPMTAQEEEDERILQEEEQRVAQQQQQQQQVQEAVTQQPGEILDE